MGCRDVGRCWEQAFKNKRLNPIKELMIRGLVILGKLAYFDREKK
tara:strand:+ start:2593 stop:2727 length:135 start_codon:yes stop_codon:yes gene_type:complete